MGGRRLVPSGLSGSSTGGVRSPYRHGDRARNAYWVCERANTPLRLAVLDSPSMRMIERFMTRYRGTRGLFGWIVERADVRWIKRMSKTAKRVTTAMVVEPPRRSGRPT